MPGHYGGKKGGMKSAKMKKQAATAISMKKAGKKPKKRNKTGAGYKPNNLATTHRPYHWSYPGKCSSKFLKFYSINSPPLAI